MDIFHNKEKGLFILTGDNNMHLGEIAYTEKNKDTFIATRTEVPKEHAGKGYATVLLDALVNYARKENKHIEPACSFVKASFEKYKDKYADVNFITP